MLANEFVVGTPFWDGLLGVGQNFVSSLAGRALEQHVFDDHCAVPPRI
jgi:hypothetical protein